MCCLCLSLQLSEKICEKISEEEERIRKKKRSCNFTQCHRGYSGTDSTRD